MAFFKGTPGGFEQLKRYAPGQEQIINQLGPMIMSQLQAGQGGFDPIRQNVLRTYKEDILPATKQSWSDVPGGQRSSGFLEALQRGEQGLATQLGAMESQYNLQREGNLANLLQQGLQPTSENIYRPQQESDFSQLLPGIGQGIGSLGAPAAKGITGLLSDWFQNRRQQQQPAQAGQRPQSKFGDILGGAFTGASTGAALGGPAGAAAGGGIALLLKLLPLLFANRQQQGANQGISMGPTA